MEGKPRIEFIDLAKGVCILLVVTGHVIESVNISCPILFCLRMPLYFCLSGLFFKPYNGFTDFLRRKTNKLLIPFVFFYLFSYLVYALGNILVGRSLSEARFHLLDLFFNDSFFNIPLWFLLCLFEMNMLSYLLVKLGNKLKGGIIAGMIFCAFIGFYCARNNVSNPLFLLTSFTCIPFFFLGYFLKRTNLLLPSTHHTIEILTAAVFVLIACIIAFTCDTPPRIQYFRNTIVSGNFLQIYICSTLLVCGLLLICKQIGRLPIISYFGRYSIIILCTHLLISPISGTIIMKLSELGYLSESYCPYLNLLVVLSSMFAIIPFARRFLPYFVAQKDLIPEKFINH